MCRPRLIFARLENPRLVQANPAGQVLSNARTPHPAGSRVLAASLSSSYSAALRSLQRRRQASGLDGSSAKKGNSRRDGQGSRNRNVGRRLAKSFAVTVAKIQRPAGFLLFFGESHARTLVRLFEPLRQAGTDVLPEPLATLQFPEPVARLAVRMRWADSRRCLSTLTAPQSLAQYLPVDLDQAVIQAAELEFGTQQIMLRLPADCVLRSGDLDEITEKRSRLSDDVTSSLPVIGFQPGAACLRQYVTRACIAHFRPSRAPMTHSAVC